MSPGKAIAQGAHVAVLSAVDVLRTRPELYFNWTSEGHAKIALRVESVEELDAIYRSAREAGLVSAIVADFGLTELVAGTKTAVAIGPDLVEKVDSITKDLKLA